MLEYRGEGEEAAEDGDDAVDVDNGSDDEEDKDDEDMDGSGAFALVMTSRLNGIGKINSDVTPDNTTTVAIAMIAATFLVGSGKFQSRFHRKVGGDQCILPRNICCQDISVGKVFSLEQW